MFNTALSNVDSYKLGHASMYPVGTTKVFSNFTPRSENHFNVPKEYKEGKIVWAGFQVFLHELKDLWQRTFFDADREEVVQEFATLVAPFCGPNGFDVKHIYDLHDLGYLPLEIRALPEGSLVNIGVPVLTITNTLPEFYWLPNYLESWMSADMWKCPTSATMSRVYRRIINKFAEITGGNKDFTAWQGHDFSMRGMSGCTDAAKSGIGHLISSMGTDNIAAVNLINKIYKGKETFIGGSVPATEHSVMCAGGKDTEVDTYRRLITQYPSGLISIVSDTWDYWNVLANTSAILKEEILARVPDSLGMAKVVFRPDSGDPVKIICGDINAPKNSPEYKGSVQVLWDIFGGTTNDKGYRTLNQRVGLIYGDSITPQRCEEILSLLESKGFASDNVVFGVGSYTYQYVTRDTFGFAMKATYVEINGEGQAIFKDPKTDSGTKKSAKGLLRVEKENGNYVLYDNQTIEQTYQGEMKTVFLNGSLQALCSFEEIRTRLATEG